MYVIGKKEKVKIYINECDLCKKYVADFMTFYIMQSG